MCVHIILISCKSNAYRVNGLSSIKKWTCTMKMMVYGLATNKSNEYCKIYKNTTIECLKLFVRVIWEFFEIEYLWQPSQDDIEK